jgi:hypothetical protein
MQYEEAPSLSPPQPEVPMEEDRKEEPLIVEDDDTEPDDTVEADKTIDMDQKVAFSQNYDNPKQPRLSLNPFANQTAPIQLAAPSPARKSPARAHSPVKPSPRRVFSDESQRARPPSSLAALTPQKLANFRSPAKAAAQPFKPRPSVVFPTRPAVKLETPIKKHEPVVEAPPAAFEDDEPMDEDQEEAEDGARAAEIVSQLTLEEFFQLTNTQFMDDVFSGKRKSMHQPQDGGETTTSAWRYHAIQKA